MSEPPQPSWQGNQPSDPTAPMPPTPPSSGPPSPQPPPSYGQPDPFAAPPPPPPSSGQPDPFAAPPPPAFGGQVPPPGQPAPGFGQPMPGQPYPGGPGFPGAAPPKKSKAGKIALIIGIVAVVLLCACGAGAVWLINEAGDEIERQIDTLPTVDVTAPPTGAPTGAPTAAPTGGTGTDGEEFAVGDCLVNRGTDDDAEMDKVACEAGALEVVAKIPATTDTNQCDDPVLGAGAGNYDSYYTYDETLGVANDFVLCLKTLE